jgi:pilus assembly protein TadC
MAKNSNYVLIGRIFGRERIRGFGTFLSTGGFTISPERFAGLYVVLCFLLSIVLSIVFVYEPTVRLVVFSVFLFIARPLVLASSMTVPVLSVIFAFIGTFLIAAILVYVVVVLYADNRKKNVEESLPDFLILAAANVRAGMTIDRALWYAAKPEFGLLSEEIQVVAKRTFGGVPFNESIDHLNERFNSKMVRRTVSLIKQGLASGSKVAVILERTARDARDMQIIRKEIAASLLMYVIFVVFAAAVGTPFLFSVCGRLIFLMENVFSQVPTTGSAQMMGGSMLITPQPPIVSGDEFILFIFMSMLVTTITSSLMIGVIKNGNKRDGIKFMPFVKGMGA